MRVSEISVKRIRVNQGLGVNIYVYKTTEARVNTVAIPTTHLGPIWYHSELSDVPYSPNQFLALDFFLQLLTARLL